MKRQVTKTLYGIMAVRAVMTTIYSERSVVGSIAPRIGVVGQTVTYEVMDALNYSRGDFNANVREAERLQSEFDEDADPVRVYVYEQQPGSPPIPVYAAFGQRRPSFGMEYELYRTGVSNDFERLFP